MNTGPAEAGTGESGRHLPDEPHRHARNEVGVTDIEDQSRRRMVARVHDLEHHLHLLRRRAGDAGRRLECLEHVTGAHALRASPIDEDDLLGTGEHMEIALGDHGALEPAVHWRGAYLTRVLARLERKRQVAVVDTTELHDQVRQLLSLL